MTMFDQQQGTERQCKTCGREESYLWFMQNGIRIGIVESPTENSMYFCSEKCRIAYEI